ncbi:PRDX4, partial [Cordylochernes scorpioides]
MLRFSCNFALVLFICFGISFAQQRCHSYQDGQVYPQESTKSSSHNLHWSKTQSKLFRYTFPLKIGLTVGVIRQCLYAGFPVWSSTFVCPTEIIAFSVHLRQALLTFVCPTEIIAFSVHLRQALLTFVCPTEIIAFSVHLRQALLTFVCPTEIIAFSVHLRQALLTFVCPTEIIAFSDRIKEFHAINTEVVACSVDSPFTHLAWINQGRKLGGLGPINIPLLSDLTHQISKDYGVYLDDLGHSLRVISSLVLPILPVRLARAWLHLEASKVESCIIFHQMLLWWFEMPCYEYQVNHTECYRGLFIIDPKGTLRQITMNDLPVGRSVDETLRLVQAFQYTDTNGEVCPANWKPGAATVSPPWKPFVFLPLEQISTKVEGLEEFLPIPKIEFKIVSKRNTVDYREKL